MTLIFATNNPNKVKEIMAITGPPFNIISLKQAGIEKEIPEPHDTIEANATEKSSVIYQLTGQNCFSEDTGLEVSALDGAPGVKSARYAGENLPMEAHINKLLHELKDKKSREARFRTVISLILDGKEYLFEGICNGHITTSPIGTEGFGYDAVFIPEGADKTFGEMTLAEKTIYSHRKKATKQLISFLQTKI